MNEKRLISNQNPEKMQKNGLFRILLDKVATESCYFNCPAIWEWGYKLSLKK
jgi:hypothetical protein